MFYDKKINRTCLKNIKSSHLPFVVLKKEGGGGGGVERAGVVEEWFNETSEIPETKSVRLI